MTISHQITLFLGVYKCSYIIHFYLLTVMNFSRCIPLFIDGYEYFTLNPFFLDGYEHFTSKPLVSWRLQAFHVKNSWFNERRVFPNSSLPLLFPSLLLTYIGWKISVSEQIFSGFGAEWRADPRASVALFAVYWDIALGSGARAYRHIYGGCGNATVPGVIMIGTSWGFEYDRIQG